MKILSRKNLWVDAIIAGRLVQAKVYDDESTFGINDGRISKLSILKTDKRDCNQSYFKQCDYDYDRGDGFDNLPKGLLSKIVSKLETIPKLGY